MRTGILWADSAWSINFFIISLSVVPVVSNEQSMPRSLHVNDTMFNPYFSHVGKYCHYMKFSCARFKKLLAQCTSHDSPVCIFLVYYSWDCSDYVIEPDVYLNRQCCITPHSGYSHKTMIKTPNCIFTLQSVKYSFWLHHYQKSWNTRRKIHLLKWWKIQKTIHLHQHQVSRLNVLCGIMESVSLLRKAQMWRRIKEGKKLYL